MNNPLKFRLVSAAVRNLGTRGVVLAVLALTAPLGAFTAATALSGSDPLSAPADFVSAVATEAGLATSNAEQPAPFSNTTIAGNAPVLGSPVGGSSRSALTASDVSPTTSPTTDAAGTASPTADGPHTNGHGCDDIIHAEGATPSAGGPVGCTVGNSGDHRQNGKHQATATPTATGSATATPTPDSDADTKTDPHANGHGCDDIIHGPDATPGAHGGPVGCTVGNSGDHRQNGQHGNGSGTATPTPTSTPDPTATNAASTSGSSRSGGHGNSKNK